MNSGALQVYQQVREAENASLQDGAEGWYKEAGKRERERERGREWPRESDKRCGFLIKILPKTLLHLAPAL